MDEIKIIKTNHPTKEKKTRKPKKPVEPKPVIKIITGTKTVSFD